MQLRPQLIVVLFHWLVSLMAHRGVASHRSNAAEHSQPQQPEWGLTGSALPPNLTLASLVHSQLDQSKWLSLALWVHPMRISCCTAVGLLVSTRVTKNKCFGEDCGAVFEDGGLMELARFYDAAKQNQTRAITRCMMQ